MDTLESLGNVVGNTTEYINNTRVMKNIYSSVLWNTIRRKISETTNVDAIISIDPECVTETQGFVCKHKVTYQLNDNIQEEYFDNHKIMRLCKETGYPLDKHFSVKHIFL